MANRITKKELKQPDEFHTLSWKALQFLSNHRREVYLYSGIVVAVVVLVVGWYLYRLYYESRANEMYARAYASYGTANVSQDQESLKKAVGLYDELVKEYPESRAAELALYNLGNLYYSLGDAEKSIGAYESYLQESRDTSMLRALAYYGLGYSYELKNDYEGALKNFESAEKHALGSHFKVINYANIGRIYEKMGNIPKAVEYYGKVMGKDVDPFMQGLMKNKIATLS